MREGDGDSVGNGCIGDSASVATSTVAFTVPRILAAPTHDFSPRIRPTPLNLSRDTAVFHGGSSIRPTSDVRR